MVQQLKNQVAVITGASAGIGRATAIEFALRGANVGLISRNEERLESLKQELIALGVRAATAVADVADPDSLEAAANKLELELGPIDIWVNNAMTTVFAPVVRIKPEEFKRVTEVTYLGVVYGTQTALARMLPRNRGTIVLVGSALAYRGIPLQAPYCAAKHAIQGFFDSLRTELMHENSKVHLTMVQLPAHNTPQFDWSKSRMPKKAQPVPPIFQPEVAARAIVWAATHKRRELVVGLPSWIAIYANKLFPWLADKQLAKTGYKSQQTSQQEDLNRPNNLWQTVSGTYGAHGRFDERAKRNSWHLWLTTHRKPVLIVASALAALLVPMLKNDD